MEEVNKKREVKFNAKEEVKDKIRDRGNS